MGRLQICYHSAVKSAQLRSFLFLLQTFLYELLLIKEITVSKSVLTKIGKFGTNKKRYLFTKTAKFLTKINFVKNHLASGNFFNNLIIIILYC